MIGAVAVARADAPRYRAVNETAYGKAFVAQRRDATSVSAAIRLTLANAAGYFGVRPVLHRSVDYLNVDKIVDDLNERDSGRYRQIPLRDENHPL